MDSKCPEFESTFCNVEQQITVVFTKLQINCPQKALMDLQEQGLNLLSRLDFFPLHSVAITESNLIVIFSKSVRVVRLFFVIVCIVIIMCLHEFMWYERLGNIILF